MAHGNHMVQKEEAQCELMSHKVCENDMTEGHTVIWSHPFFSKAECQGGWLINKVKRRRLRLQISRVALEGTAVLQPEFHHKGPCS